MSDQLAVHNNILEGHASNVQELDAAYAEGKINSS
jgi:hypothetical protein